jgi:hypothetical protein
MQTYTHVLMGGVIAAIFFRDNTLAQVGCIVASAVPDLTMVPQYLKDLVAKRQPMTQQSDKLILWKEIGHSFLLWFLLTVLGATLLAKFGPTLLATALGGLTHTIVDILTHGTGPRENRPYWDTDVKFMWPTSMDLRPLGVWEYRIAHGVLRPKPVEAMVDVLCLGIIVWFLLLD